MSENVDQCFPKPEMMSSNVLFFPQPKDNQFTVIEDEINQKTFTFKTCFFFKKYSNRLINYQNS